MVVYSGPESRKFLQGQLSCDTEKLAVGEWAWGGYLTLKGRLLSTFVAVALADDSIGLVMDKGLVPLTVKKLRMYQLRAKTKHEVDGRKLAGLVGDGFADADDKVIRDAHGAELVLPLGGGAALALGMDCGVDPSAKNAFVASCARAGMPWLTEALQEQLTVHMVSLDLAGGVDFEKGCYLGQEIVIRTHHRGQVKKRAFVATGDGEAPKPGTEVLSEVHGGQVAGQIVYSARENGGFCALAALRKDAVEGALELADGRDVAATAPPYGLVDEKFEKA